MPDAFVARQPIFNPKLEVVGYELLFRGEGYANDVAMIANPESATATVVLNALTELDLGRLVGSRTAWVNISREFVTGGLAHALPSGLVGLEIPETEQFDDEMLGALGELKQQGYKLALDDFRYREGSEALLELFDVVKLNINELGREQLSELVQRLKPYEGKLVAEKLSTQADHEFCVDAGCDLFQGYFFCRPAVACTRGIAANRLALLQVAAVLNDPDVQLEQIEQLIVHDVALSFRLLRYVNSAFFGLRGDVRSIGQALALLGLENVKRWATLSVLASIDDKPTELTVTALIRARFCELAGEPLGIASPAELFTLGLFSVLDAMMDAPMVDVIASLPLATEMREALVCRQGQARPVAAVRRRARDRRGQRPASGRRGRRRAVPRGDDVGEQRRRLAVQRRRAERARQEHATAGVAAGPRPRCGACPRPGRPSRLRSTPGTSSPSRSGVR